MSLHRVFPLPRTAAKKHDKENCQHQLYVQKSMANTKHYKAAHERSVSRKRGEREIFLKTGTIYTYKVKHLRQSSNAGMYI